MRVIGACVCAAVTWPAVASGDRAVARTDRLEGGTVEVGLGMESVVRTADVRREFGTTDLDAKQVAAVPRLRVWLTDWLDLELRQPLSFVRTLHQDGSSRDAED